MGNNSSKPVSSSKKKNINKKTSNTSRKTNDEINTTKSNTNKSVNSSATLDERDIIGSKQSTKVAPSLSNKPLLKKKNKSSSKAIFNSSSSDDDNEADQEDIGTADIDDDEDRLSLGSSKRFQNEQKNTSKSHKRTTSQGSVLTSPNQTVPLSTTGRRKSYNGSSVLTKTSSRNSSSGNDHQRPILKNRAKSMESVYSSQHTPKMSSRKSSMSEVPASMVMSLEPKASILKRTFSNVSSSASQSRHASDNALTDGYDDEDDEDDEDEDYTNIEQKIKDGVYIGYNPSEVYEDIYKSGNISRGILRNSTSNGNIRSASVSNSRRGRNSSSSMPGGLTRSSTKGSTSNSEINFSGTRKFSGSGSETNYHHGNVVDMVDGLVLNSNDAPPPLIHRHSSFGTNTDNDNYPQKLDFSHQKNNDVFEDDYGIESNPEYANEKEGYKTHSRKHSGEYYGDMNQQNITTQQGSQDYMANGDAQEQHMDSDEMYPQDPNSFDRGDDLQFRNPEHTYIQGPGKNKKPLDLDATIQKLLDAGYSGKRTKNVILKNSEIHQICAIAGEIFMQQPSLVELSPPVKIVGDVHGQFHDLIRMFEKCGFPPTSNYLFLGDYVDRGKQSLETILLLLCYKIKYPENFFLLRGNHECASVTRVYGFYDECKRRCNVRTWKYFIDTFNTMPLASIVAGKIFCVHGGLSPVLNSMDEIRLVSRPTDVPDFGLINDLLWSDPTDSVNEWEDNERGVSYCYNKVAINKFLNRFGFDLVCRAHMVVEDGYEFFNDHTLVTVFSAPNYCGEFDNWGAVMSVNHELLCSFELLEPLDSIALKQVMKKGKLERKLAVEDTQDSNIQYPQDTADIGH